MHGRNKGRDLQLLEGEERERAYQRQELRRKFKKALPVLVAVLLVAVIALVHVFVPLSLLLPAYQVEVRGEGELRVHFLDVGQGDCTLVEFPSGEVVVLDAGDGSFGHRNHLVRYVKALSPAKLTLLLTHADADHYGGFRALIGAFGADEVYLPALGEDTPEYAALLKAVENSGAAVDTILRYDVLTDGSGAYLACISPKSGEEGDGNDTSAVMYLSYEGVGVLLAGDISSSVERRLVREYALMEGIFDCGEYRVRLEETDVVKVSHHGSGYSNSEEWLSLLSPTCAVLSCGKGNAFSHPSVEALDRIASAGAEIYRTDELGDIIVTINEGKYSLSFRT